MLKKYKYFETCVNCTEHENWNLSFTSCLRHLVLVRPGLSIGQGNCDCLDDKYSVLFFAKYYRFPLSQLVLDIEEVSGEDTET